MLGSPRRWTIAAAILCGLGALLRILAYAEHRALWFDEAALAMNIVSRGFFALLSPLDDLQAAPPLFLWVSRAAVLVGGWNEWSLRAVPLLAGIASAPLMWRIARRILEPVAAVFAVGLIALSPPLVHYAAEAKPYAVDAFVTLVMLDRAVSVAKAPVRRSAWWWLAVCGAIALTLSTAAPFVLAGVGSFLLVRAFLDHDRASVRRTLAVGGSWVAVLLVLVGTVFRPLVSGASELGRFMHWYWSANFLTTEPPGLAAKISALLWVLLTDTFLGGAAPAGATTVLCGAVALGVVMLLLVRRVPELVLLAVPAVCLVVASALRIYPIAQRLALFLAPMSALIIAASLLVTALVGRRSNWLAGIVGAAVLVIATRGAVQQIGSSAGKPQARDLVGVAAGMHARGLPVWVSGGGSPAWRFYTSTSTMVQPPRTIDTTSTGGMIADGVLVGAWYNSVPERIRNVQDDVDALSQPSAWSATEAARIRDLARPCAVIFISFIRPGEPQALLASVTALGARVVERREGDDTELYHVCFDQK